MFAIQCWSIKKKKRQQQQQQQFVFLNGQWKQQEMNLYNYDSVILESFRFEEEKEYEI